MSKAFKFSQAVKELRIHLCNSQTSAGVREFIKKNYVDFKTLNQQVPILIRESSNAQPKLWARYEFGKESNQSLANLNESQVLSVLEKLAKQ